MSTLVPPPSYRQIRNGRTRTVEERGYYGAITSNFPEECVRFRTAEDMAEFNREYLLLCEKYRNLYEGYSCSKM